MSNPFEDNNNNQNAWSNDGPRYGNAYESTPPPPPVLPPRKNNKSTNKTQVPDSSSPYQTQRMPSPSTYNNNAWAAESNKTLEEARNSPVPTPVNAYQYVGTHSGNNTPYSPQMSVVDNNNEHKPHKIEAPMSVADSPTDTTASLPSKIRLGLRVALFIAAVGHLGFAAGASPFSGHEVPFDSPSCFYYLFAVAVMSIIYSGYSIVFYMFRRFGSAERMNRVILILCDLLMTLLWGIGIIVEVAQYQCKPGTLDGWCNFYNTSIFFGFLSFAVYIVLLGWDAFGCLCGVRGRKD